MLKWARRIFVFLLIGAMVNVAVAWVIVLANDDVLKPAPVATQLPNQVSRTQLSVGPRFGYQLVSDYGRGPLGFLGSAQLYNGRVWWSNPQCNGPEFWDHVGAGWPMLALSASRHTVLDLEGREVVDRVIRLHGGVALHQDRDDPTAESRTPRLLPLRPLWLGFILNSLAYATGLGTIVHGPTTVRSFLLGRRGECPACGYPRGSSPVCTECGEALPCSAISAARR